MYSNASQVRAPVRYRADPGLADDSQQRSIKDKRIAWGPRTSIISWYEASCKIQPCLEAL